MGTDTFTVSNGFCEIELKMWDEFEPLIKLIPDNEHFVWRGQASAKWAINASLQREIKKIRKKGIDVRAPLKIGFSPVNN